MLSFNSNLTDKLNASATAPVWLLKLFYDDEASATLLSDRHIEVGSDFYNGLVMSWGDLLQTIDIDDFTASPLSFSITLANTPNSIEGGRFSDLFSSRGYTNRTWELYLFAEGLADADKELIGKGVISGDVEHSHTSVKLRLLDMGAKHHKDIPTNTVLKGTYASASPKSWDKAIPMAFGDFDVRTDIGTVPTSTAEFDRHFTGGKFPAIITNKYNQSTKYVEAKPDASAVHTLDTENVYLYNNGHYAAFDDSSSQVAVDASSPIVKVRGNTCRAYIPCTDGGNMTDGDFSTSVTMTANAGNSYQAIDRGFAIPKIPKMGEYKAIKLFVDYASPGTAPGGGDTWRLTDGTIHLNLTWPSSSPYDLSVDISSYFTTTEQTDWDFEQDLTFELDTSSTSTATNITINQVGVEVEFGGDQNFESEVIEEETGYGGRWTATTRRGWKIDVKDPRPTLRIKRDFWRPVNVEYLYCSGKGRKYGSWIDADSRDNGYNETDLIENPAYIVESMLRDELSLTSSEIDYASFDSAGNTTDGDLLNTFNDSMTDVKFAFSQHTFSDSLAFADRVCKQSGIYFFFGGEGKAKVKARRQSYSSSNKTVDFNDIQLSLMNRTPVSAIRNDVQVNYAYDYGAKQTVNSVTSTDDSNLKDTTSQGSSASGYNRVQKLIVELDAILDKTTALNYGKALLAWLKDRRTVLDFHCLRPKYLDLEIADVIIFSNWPSDLKVFGDTVDSSDYFMVTDISKRPSGCKVKAVKVG